MLTTCQSSSIIAIITEIVWNGELKMKKSNIHAIFAIGLAALLASVSYAKREAIEIGSQAPSWESLPGADGKTHSLADFKEAKAVVVIFTCNSCPVAQAYEERLAKLQEKYDSQGVKLIAINASSHETLDDVAKHAKKRNFSFDYYDDSSGEVSKAFGATRTPEVFLLDGDRKVVYTGAIDDDVKLQGKPQTHYLDDAIVAILAGKKPKTSKTTAIGCAIR